MTEQSPPQDEPYQAPQVQPYGTPVVQPYGSPVVQPYGSPVVQPYGTPAAQPVPANEAAPAIQPPQSQQAWNPDEIPWRRRQAAQGGPPVGQFNDQVARTSPVGIVIFVVLAVVIGVALSLI
jgi:hypothetical protein